MPRDFPNGHFPPRWQVASVGLQRLAHPDTAFSVRAALIRPHRAPPRFWRQSVVILSRNAPRLPEGALKSAMASAQQPFSLGWVTAFQCACHFTDDNRNLASWAEFHTCSGSCNVGGKLTLVCEDHPSVPSQTPSAAVNARSQSLPITADYNPIGRKYLSKVSDKGMERYSIPLSGRNGLGSSKASGKKNRASIRLTVP